MARSDSLFFRSLEPDHGWNGDREAVTASQRARMLDAITRAVAEKGYAHVTVGDVVGIAGVSRRTFYEQFKDRDECFLAAYETGTAALIDRMVRESLEVGRDAEWRALLRAAIEAYVGILAEEPEFARTFLVDVLGAGPKAIERRSVVYEQFVEQYVGLSKLASTQEPDLIEVPEIYLRALVGGIGELVQQHLLANDPETLPELAPVLVQLATAVIQGAGVRAAAA